MKAWKHILILVGALGVVGAFLPLIEVHHGPVAFAFTARELTFGMERSHRLIERELPKLIEARLPTSVREGRGDVLVVAEASRGAILLFVPAALLVLLGAIGLWRGRVGRVIGALAVVLGLASLASWFALRYGIDYGLAEAALHRTTVNLLVGAHLLLVVGIAAILTGLGAIARPESAPVRRSWQPHVPPPPR